jgi:hypothetical protein
VPLWTVAGHERTTLVSAAGLPEGPSDVDVISGGSGLTLSMTAVSRSFDGCEGAQSVAPSGLFILRKATMR